MKKKEMGNGLGGAIDTLMRSKEVMETLKISRTTLQSLIGAGVLSPIMVGKKAQRFSSRQLNEFIETLKGKQQITKPITIFAEFTPNEKATLHAICEEFPGCDQMEL